MKVFNGNGTTATLEVVQHEDFGFGTFSLVDPSGDGDKCYGYQTREEAETALSNLAAAPAEGQKRGYRAGL